MGLTAADTLILRLPQRNRLPLERKRGTPPGVRSATGFAEVRRCPLFPGISPASYIPINAPRFPLRYDAGHAWGSRVTEALSRQKPWSRMTDDEKLVATFLFMALYAAQLIFLVPVTLILGAAWAGDGPINAVIRGPELLLDYLPALTGIMFALLFFFWMPLRRSGQWIWVAVALFELRFGLRQELLGRMPLDVVVNTPALACVLYSLTMFVLNRKIKGTAQSQPANPLS